PSRRPGLLARGVGHVAGHVAPTPRGPARRARALRAPRAPAPSLSPRRQDQDEQLSAESSPSPEVSCKVTGIEAKEAEMSGISLLRSGKGPMDGWVAHAYDRGVQAAFREIFPKLVEDLLDEMRGVRRALDVGCGPGQ